MTAKYQLLYEDVSAQKDAMGTDKPIEIDVMNNETKVWARSKVLISEQPIEGGEEVNVMGGWYGTPVAGKWYIKILEEMVAEE
jgi:hypothetical protein